MVEHVLTEAMFFNVNTTEMAPRRDKAEGKVLQVMFPGNI